MIDRFDETRHLVKIQVFYDGQNAYSFNYEGKVHVFRGTVEQLAKFLQSFKAKDNKTNPRSHRGERYIDIANEITDGSDNIIFAWSNDLMNVLNRRESTETVEVEESVRFTAEGPEVSNDDHKILDDLFTMLDGDPRWEVDTDHGLCTKNDGLGFFQIKGNEVLMKSGRAEAKASWVKGTTFLLRGDGTVVVTFKVPGSEGRFEI